MDPTQQAYQDFLLGGKRGAAATVPNSPRQQKEHSSSNLKKRKKNVGPIFKAFQGRLEEWKEIDGQLEKMLGSIANLRDRIWWESQRSERLSEPRKSWDGAGFRCMDTLLTVGDIELALSHDILQHEKMLSGVRISMSSLAQVHEAMGRRLDEWMTVQLEDSSTQGKELMNQAQDVYLWLADSLYRKQMAVQKILDSCTDELVANTSKPGENLSGVTPRDVSRQCYNQWSGPKNRIQAVDDLLIIGSLKN